MLVYNIIIIFILCGQIKATGLKPLERIRLVEAILYSLDKPDPNIEQCWIAESEARYEAYKRGELEAIDWDKIKKRYER